MPAVADPWTGLLAALAGIDAAARQLAGVLPADRAILILLASSTGLALAWALIETILDDRETLPQAVGQGVQAIMVGLLCFSVLKNYSQFTDSFLNGTAWLTKKFAGDRDMFNLAIGNAKSALDTVSSGDIYSIKNGFDLVDALNHLSDWMLASLVGFLVAGVVAISGGMAIWVALLAKIAFGLGAALGPIFISVAPLPLLRSWALSWLKYMMTVSLYTVSATVALIMMEGVFQVMPASMAGLVDPATKLIRLPMALALLVVGLGGIVVMWQIPKLTDKMLSGGSMGLK